MSSPLARLSDLSRFRSIARGVAPGPVRSEGAVLIEADSVTLRELGEARSGGRSWPVTNAYRLEPDGDRVRVGHLRFGADRPVELVTLRPEAPGRWRSVEPHVCGPDRYACRVRRWRGALAVRWRITGPGKDQTVTTIYS